MNSVDQCIASCCSHCSYCSRVFTRAAFGCKPHEKMLCFAFNKICSKCFLCRSLTRCPSCHKCSTCCPSTGCGRKIKSPLGDLAVSRCIKQSGSDLERRVHSTLQGQTQTHKASNHCKRLCTCSQERLPDGSIAFAYGQKCGGEGPSSGLSSLFQSVVPGTQTKQPMETNFRPQCPQQIFASRHLQNGNPREYQNISKARGVGNFHRFQGRLLSHPHTSTIQKVPKVSFAGPVVSV